jgi:hypothetical protein
MPVQRRFHVALIRDVDNQLRTLIDMQGRTGDRAVVREHPQHVAAEVLAHRRDLQTEVVAVA